MKLPIALFALAFVSSVHAGPAGNSGGESSVGKDAGYGASELAADTAAPAVKRYPLTGIVTAVYGERTALMVKHEDIPGLMRAMTMMFKVDEATVKTVKIGDKISAQVSREDGAWQLHDVKVVEAKKH